MNGPNGRPSVKKNAQPSGTTTKMREKNTTNVFVSKGEPGRQSNWKRKPDIQSKKLHNVETLSGLDDRWRTPNVTVIFDELEVDRRNARANSTLQVGHVQFLRRPRAHTVWLFRVEVRLPSSITGHCFLACYQVTTREMSATGRNWIAPFFAVWLLFLESINIMNIHGHLDIAIVIHDVISFFALFFVWMTTKSRNIDSHCREIRKEMSW